MSTEKPSFDAPLTVRDQIEARAAHPATENKVVLMHNDRTWTYRQFRDESVRTAHFLLHRLGKTDEAHPAHVAMILENHLELMSLYGGCAYAGATLFGVNTGLRGDVLAGVLNQSRARVLVVDQRFLSEVEKVRDKLEHVALENILVLSSGRARAGHAERLDAADVGRAADFVACVAAEGGAERTRSTRRGSTSRPIATDDHLHLRNDRSAEGHQQQHMKLCLVGMASRRTSASGRTTSAMPACRSSTPTRCSSASCPHSGSAARWRCANRFSASSSCPTCWRHGVTYWNYVGEPVHYVLSAIEKQYGGDERGIAAEVTNHPATASASGRQRRLAARHRSLHEMDGSRRCSSSTVRPRPRSAPSPQGRPARQRRRGDGCGGEISSFRRPGVSPAELGPDGKILNYAAAVGEICRVAPDTALFQGYFGNPDANASKYRDNVYHSGDLGHIVVKGAQRFLYFDGRTDDWIRKDGENFSAAQVARLLGEHPDVSLAAAYGVPCSVSDELVMAALKLREGARFDPKGFFDWCEAQVSGASMDRKWFPDFVRVVDDFEYTQTQKVLVRAYKKVHFVCAASRGRITGANAATRPRPFTKGDSRRYARIRQTESRSCWIAEPSRRQRLGSARPRGESRYPTSRLRQAIFSLRTSALNTFVSSPRSVARSAARVSGLSRTNSRTPLSTAAAAGGVEPREARP